MKSLHEIIQGSFEQNICAVCFLQLLLCVGEFFGKTTEAEAEWKEYKSGAKKGVRLENDTVYVLVKWHKIQNIVSHTCVLIPKRMTCWLIDAA